MSGPGGSGKNEPAPPIAFILCWKFGEYDDEKTVNPS